MTLIMEMFPDGGNGGNDVPLPVSNSCQIGVGSENQNTEGVAGSYIELEPEMFDFSSFLKGEVIDDIFLVYKEKINQFSSTLPRTGLVTEMVEEAVASKNAEHPVQPPPPPPPPPPPQNPSPILYIRPSGRLKWTKELHSIFVDAVKQLGGAFIATPKTVKNIMNIEGLTLHQVKSHLQQYRTGKRLCYEWIKLYRRGSSFCRTFSAASNATASSQPPQSKKHRGNPYKRETEAERMKILFFKHVERLLEVQRQYAIIAAARMAANQNMGGSPFVVDQNIGGHVFAPKNQIGECALVGTESYPGNGLTREATLAPMQSYYPYQLNSYHGCTSTGAVNAAIVTCQKPDELQSMPVAYPHQLSQANFPAEAASSSYQQGFNSDAGESSVIAGMTDEEIVESFLIDYDDLVGDSW